MSRRKKDPLRPLTPEETETLTRLSRAQSVPASHVIRARLILAVAAGLDYTQAAKSVGRKDRDCVSDLVSLFNRDGIQSVVPGHGGGFQPRYTEAEKARILEEFKRVPDRELDRTASWSLSTLQRALRRASDGLPTVSTYTLRMVLNEAGYSWQKDRTWCQTGQVERKRKNGIVTVVDPETEVKKKLIERAYRIAEILGLAVWCEDEAGPYQTVPYPGSHWCPSGQPQRQPHEYFREGTAKLLTLFHPATGQVRMKGVTRSHNVILHAWLKTELTAILADLPAPVPQSAEQTRCLWQSWQTGLSLSFGLSANPPTLRLLLVMDNLAGHKSLDWVRWCYQRGILILYTPLGGSWLNMAESIQRIIKRRALDGTYPRTVETIIDWLEAAARGWNQDPTPFVWGGKRQQRRRAQRERALHRLGGSGACTQRPVR